MRINAATLGEMEVLAKTGGRFFKTFKKSIVYYSVLKLRVFKNRKEIVPVALDPNNGYINTIHFKQDVGRPGGISFGKST